MTKNKKTKVNEVKKNTVILTRKVTNVQNFGEYPMRAYEMIRNTLIGIN